MVTHQRLVRYYSFFGFRPVKYVDGGRLADLPDLLAWGGAGTRMDADVDAMLRRWTPRLRREARGAAAAAAVVAAAAAAAGEAGDSGG